MDNRTEIILPDKDEDPKDLEINHLMQIAAVGGVIGGFLALLVLAWIGALGEEK